MPASPPYALPEGYNIGGYRIVGYVGAGGFGIVYEALNPVTRERVAIKEYFPRQMVSRQGSTVIPHNPQQEEIHRAVLERFAFTTGLQFGFDHKNILKVKNYIQGNNTGFMIAELVDGPSLGRYLAQSGGHFPNYAAFQHVMNQLVGAIGYVHRKHHLHRDISPENVLVDHAGRPVLIDFGSLKRNIDAKGPSTFISYRDEYSPPEQRVRLSPERFYTDIYALAGTMYFSLSGHPPVSAESRSHGFVNDKADPYVPIAAAAKIACPPEVCRAIDRALRLPVSERQQIIEEFAAELGWQPDYGGVDEHSDVTKLTTLDTIVVEDEPVFGAMPDPERPVLGGAGGVAFDPGPGGEAGPGAASPNNNARPATRAGNYALVLLVPLLIATALGTLWAMRSGDPSPPSVAAVTAPPSAAQPPAHAELAPATPSLTPNPDRVTPDPYRIRGDTSPLANRYPRGLAEPKPPKCGGNSDTQITAPILALYDAINRMDIDQYAAQWAVGSSYVRADTGATKTSEEKIATRRSDFLKWQSSNIKMEDVHVMGKSPTTASISIKYSMVVVNNIGKIIRDSHVTERYDVTCSSLGKWLIQRNVDFVDRPR